ncbi:cytochrome P450 [Heliocybe sulcata]|uniref:Cytochrome P450 n=1 Tax=Heliocybe sulcata TaxID=5364 RepID=A0A5C3MPS9_9AGAM|nr:cytochrome P450 [Heliocybe sulcata]
MLDIQLASTRAMLWAVFGLFVGRLFLGRILALRRGLGIVRCVVKASNIPSSGIRKNTPGEYLLWLDPFRTLALVLASAFPRPGQVAYYAGRFSRSTLVTSVRFWTGQPYYFLADADAIKHVTGDRKVFRKDVEAYEVLNIYGPTLVGTEDADWKRHRAVVNPAFNEANNALVWKETMHIVSDWFARLGKGELVDVASAMTQITLHVISSAGFGIRIPSTPSAPPESIKVSESSILPFPTALRTTISYLFAKVLTPDFLYDLSASLPCPVPLLSDKLDLTRRAFKDLREHILGVISDARAQMLGSGLPMKEARGREMAEEGSLLRNLVQANLAEGQSARGLTDDELLSNAFVSRLTAGTETSANSLTFTLAMLALHPEVQEKLYDETKRVWPRVDADADQLLNSVSYYTLREIEYTLAVFREAMRLYPAEPRLAKLVTEDTVLPYTKFKPIPEAEKARMAVSKGSVVIIDIWALHMNPIHWSGDVEVFRPERFLDRPDEGYRWPRDAFLAFSAGARGCIGIRFAMTESVCILASLVRRYEVRLPVELEGLSRRQQKEEMLKWKTGVTTTPTNVRVRLIRRSE